MAASQGGARLRPPASRRFEFVCGADEQLLSLQGSFLDHEDPRFALHSGSSEPDDFDADAKLSGRATEVVEPGERGTYAAAAGIPEEDMGFVLFRVDLDQVVLVGLDDEKTALVISSWRPGRGLTRTSR